jgi:glycosyltransferase involved in cell wall biosynthesis
MSRLERRALDEFDAHIVVSRRDGERLLKQSPRTRLFVIENGVDTSHYTDAQLEEAHASWLARRPDNSPTNSSLPLTESANERAKRRIAFVGSMDYHANVDGVVNFAEELWPLLRRQMPDLIFTIVGRDPAPEVLKLAAMQGIEVTGTVADVRPYYHEMLAAVIPLRVGGGSRLKILEAMAAGVPVISTALGAEGLDVEDGRNVIIAETGDEFCRAVAGLAQNDERRRKLIEAGRALVHERYDWSRLGTMLFESYQILLADGQANRAEARS